MLLSREQILAVPASRTREVDVPEWGEGAKVLIGVVGGMGRARISDFIRSSGRPLEPAEPDEDEVVSCDSPPQEVRTSRAQLEARRDQLDALLRQVIKAVRDRVPAAELEALLAAADDILASPGPAKDYTAEEEYKFSLIWCVESILDPDTHKRAFTFEQLQELGELDEAPIFRIAAAARDLNLESKQASAAFEKNSGGTPGSSSGGV